MAVKDDLAKIVGKKRVVADKKVLADFKSDLSFVSGKAPACVVKPKKMEEVQKIIRLANEKNFSLVPCSSAGPHAKGDTLPLVDNAVMVDLSGMDAIVRLDQRNKIAMIEPGVTFKALQTAAEAEGLRVAMPLMPRNSKSVIGSLLEREPTLFPKYHWDMSDPLCCMEVLFGTGDMFRTGSAAGPGTLEEQWAAGQAQKSPMGPSQADWGKIVQGSQGTMGMVTWTSVKLELKPRLEKAFMVGTHSLPQLIEFTYAIVNPRLPDICLILNHGDLAAILGEKPDNKLPAWVLLYSLSGYEHFPEDRVDYLEKDIADIALAKGVRPQPDLNGLSAERLMSLVNGPCKEPYWKSRSLGGFQDIFFLTTLDKAPEFVKAMEQEADKHGLARENLGIYIQPIQQGRNCHVEFTVMYDSDNKEATQSAKELFDAAGKLLIDMGGFFSRPYGPWADLAYRKCPDSVTALKKVKGILDPKGVMNPGKLCF